jgi:hypothetical protein
MLLAVRMMALTEVFMMFRRQQHDVRVLRKAKKKKLGTAAQHSEPYVVTY